jgi:hypothetical protein
MRGVPNSYPCPISSQQAKSDRATVRGSLLQVTPKHCLGLKLLCHGLILMKKISSVLNKLEKEHRKEIANV